MLGSISDWVMWHVYTVYLMLSVALWPQFDCVAAGEDISDPEQVNDFYLATSSPSGESGFSGKARPMHPEKSMAGKAPLVIPILFPVVF